MLLIPIVLYSYLFVLLKCSRVMEIGNGFLERNLTETNEKWFVMFYTPTCYYCRRFQPIWNNVAQDVSSIKVLMAKIDCSRLDHICLHFNIRQYPSFIFFKYDVHYKYNSDHSRKEMFLFAKRLSQPLTVTELETLEDFQTAKQSFSVFFIYVGSKSSSSWIEYSSVAIDYHGECSFYYAETNFFSNQLQSNGDSQLLNYKNGELSAYQNDKPLIDWIDEERFEVFQKISPETLKHILKSKKLIVFVVVKENEIKELTGDMEYFKNHMESLAINNRIKYSKYFQFCWLTFVEGIKSLILTSPKLPYFFVMNSTSDRIYLPETDVYELGPEGISIFLEQVLNNTVTSYGGNSFMIRLYRFIFVIFNTLNEMRKGNPILTVVIIGVPLMYFFLILYTTFGPNILTDDKDEFDDESNWLCLLSRLIILGKQRNKKHNIDIK